MMRTAEFSGPYRYTLSVVWGDDTNMVNFLMLNPSTADEVQNDPTVERCQRRAIAWGFGGLVVTNLFALRSTDPKMLYKHDDPVGPLNNDRIIQVAKSSRMVLCAWGNHGEFMGRGDTVMKMLFEHNLPLKCLAVTRSKQPSHPLYLPYSMRPVDLEHSL